MERERRALEIWVIPLAEVVRGRAQKPAVTAVPARAMAARNRMNTDGVGSSETAAPSIGTNTHRKHGAVERVCMPVRLGMARWAAGVRAWAPGVRGGAWGSARTGAEEAPGTLESWRPTAEGTVDGSAARAAAGRAPRRASSPKSSDDVSWYCLETVTGAASQAVDHYNGGKPEVSSEEKSIVHS